VWTGRRRVFDDFRFSRWCTFGRAQLDGKHRLADVASSAAPLHLRLAFEQLMALRTAEHQSCHLFASLLLRLSGNREDVLAFSALAARTHEFRRTDEMMLALRARYAQLAIDIPRVVFGSNALRAIVHPAVCGSFGAGIDDVRYLLGATASGTLRLFSAAAVGHSQNTSTIFASEFNRHKDERISEEGPDFSQRGRSEKLLHAAAW
jgi:hypothetical protein